VNVSPGTIRWDDTVYWPKDMLSGLDRFELAAGDVVLGMDRPWISSGIRVAELTEEDAPSLLLQRVCLITPLAALDKDYNEATIG
jgi:type I restriction enzyme, S subunit